MGRRDRLPDVRQPRPTVVPGPVRFWLDPTTLSVQTVGFQQPGAPVTGAITVPATATLRGATITWQALVFATAGVAGSNASTTFVE